jgi:hypothetical protein
MASIAAGSWLIVGAVEEPEPSGVAVPSLSVSSSEELYGGDAYTGIQNAAVATEQAVVEGMNEMFDLAVQLESSSSESSARHMSRLTIGLGVLIIGIGVLNFNIAVQRFYERP